ncbi:MAG: hypothetical protein J6S67_03485 [Methanobrevibacter sp.]|nr:hypothetical protein [Methanobrevibacter sp.]
MGKIKDRQFWESAAMNNYTFRQYYNRLTELSISMFEWVNVPDTIDTRFLELALFGDGMAIFFKDEDIGYLALRTMIGGKLDVYNIPYFRTAYASNGYNRKLTPDDSVIIFNNGLRTNSRLDVEMYAKRLYNLDRAIDVNANAQKTPILIKCDERQRLTLKNLYKEYDGNEPVIYADDAMNVNSLTVLKTDAPYVADRLYMLKTQLWNEAMTYLGISNINVQKKERMISDEVMRNMGGTIASRYSRLNARRQACEMINNMFGLDMDCQFREDFREADDEVMFSGETGDESMNDMVIDLRTQ